MFSVLLFFGKRADVWKLPISPVILVVLRSPRVKIYFPDFFSTKASYWKTNYTTIVLLVLPTYRLNMSEKQFFNVAAKLFILLDIFWHTLLKWPKGSPLGPRLANAFVCSIEERNYEKNNKTSRLWSTFDAPLKKKTLKRYKHCWNCGIYFALRASSATT